MGYTLLATTGTANEIIKVGLPVTRVKKLAEGNPNLIDYLKNDNVSLIINTPNGKNPREDEIKIRPTSMQNRIPIITTLRGADASLMAIKSLQGSAVEVRALQEYHK